MEHKGSVKLESERLILRKFRINDAESSFKNWMNSDKVTEFLRWKSHESIEITKRVLNDWIENYKRNDFYHWAIIPKELNEPIGTISVVGMDEKIDMVHIGYCIGSNWWNRGYTSEVLSILIPFFFEEVKVNRIESQFDTYNTNSGRVMKKCGLKYEGCLRQADWSNKGIVDACMYSILAKDYFMREKLKEEWLNEEKIAYIKGWDFSHINKRYDEEDDLSWDYQKVIQRYLKPHHKLLDVDTGGGEFLLSLNHPLGNCSATENFEPNVKLCKEKLLPLGIDFKKADGLDELPFEDETFDIIINRHGDFNTKDLYRLLKKGGIFITEQVGAENDRELVELLLGDIDLPFPEQYLDKISEKFKNAGFEIVRAEEEFRPIKFYDIGALVWFARIIEWEFPGFSVEKCIENLYKAQDILEEKGSVEGSIHRILLVCKK